jgi:hypothetical protein
VSSLTTLTALSLDRSNVTSVVMRAVTQRSHHAHLSGCQMCNACRNERVGGKHTPHVPMHSA